MSLIVLLITGFIYLQLQTTSIYGGDAGDLVAATFLKGVPHPPGYPLYSAIGYFLTTLNISTAAFEVGLLSSIPASFSVFFVYLISYRLSKNIISSLVAAFSLAFSYLFWLYSEVPEVFSLNLMFMSLMLYLLILINEKPRVKLIYLLSLILGLSLSHHHIILFFVPSIVYWFFSMRKKITPLFNRKVLFISILFFLIGLLPYLYLPLAASQKPAINWNDPVNLTNFKALITRADYGSFTAGGFVLNHPFARIYQFKAYTRFIITEFTLVGVIIAVVGSIYQFIKRRKYWNLLVLSFLMVGPIFLFYAAYPLSADFSLATYERFLLPSYIFIAIWIGEGVIGLSWVLNNLFVKIMPKTKSLPLVTLTSLIFLIFPISFFLAHYPKIKALKNDRTAENLAIDILRTTPKDSILILAGDTSLFNTQYVYYTEKARQDVKIFHMYKFFKDYYVADLKNQYPNLNIPPFSEDFTRSFIESNQDKYSIMSTYPIGGLGGFWVRNGLLLKYYPNEADIPSEDEILRINKDLWQVYHDPLSGALGEYNHLMLSDTAKNYSDSLYDLSEGLFRVNKYNEAIPFLEKARLYQPYSYYVSYNLGKAYYEDKQCDKALDTQLKTIELDPNLIEAYENLSLIYKDCFSDQQKSDYYLGISQEMRAEQETKLEAL